MDRVYLQISLEKNSSQPHYMAIKKVINIYYLN